MQVGKDWIDFKWKPPYSAIPGKPLPEDFLVMIVYHDPSDPPKVYEYDIISAQESTTLAKIYPDRYIAWKAFEEYNL